MPEPAAFDKDALKRLAQRAAEGPIEDAPPPPPQPEKKVPEEPVPEPVAVEPPPVPNGLPEPRAPVAQPPKKKDSSSIATMLSYAQSNVAKGKVASDKSLDTASLSQAFTIGASAGGQPSHVKGRLGRLLHQYYDIILYICTAYILIFYLTTICYIIILYIII